MAQIIAEYELSIPEKIKNINELIFAVKKERSLESLKALYFVIHKLAGNAGVYGYSQVSVICKEFGSMLMEKINNSSPSLTDEWIEKLDLYFNKINQGFLSDGQKYHNR